jgi:hypothetical protein
MYRYESIAFVPTAWLLKAKTLTKWLMLSTGVFAHAFKVLRAEDRDIGEQFALALWSLAVHLLIFDVVKVVLLVPMTTEALTCRTNNSAILARIQIAPIHIKSVFSRLSYLFFVSFKLGV